MEGLAPPLELLIAVKRSSEKGESIKMGISTYLRSSNDEFSQTVAQWLALLQQGQNPRACLAGCGSLYRRTLLEVLERGLKGDSIYAALTAIEEELIEACHEEITKKLSSLPFIMMIPLLLFQFPAFLILLFGPLLKNFFHSLGGG